jgi:hypothetical protein
LHFRPAQGDREIHMTRRRKRFALAARSLLRSACHRAQVLKPAGWQSSLWLQPAEV